MLLMRLCVCFVPVSFGNFFYSAKRPFADDCVCYREIKDTEDTLKLQKGINH